MKSAPKKAAQAAPAPERARGAVSVQPAKRRRSVRKLFQMQANPLDGNAALLAQLRAPRRQRPWLALALLVPGLLLAQQEPVGPPDSDEPPPAPAGTNEPPAPLEPPVHMDPETLTTIITNLVNALTSAPPDTAAVPAPVSQPAAAATPSRTDSSRGERDRDGRRQSGDSREASRDSRRSGDDRGGSPPASASSPQGTNAQSLAAFRIISERNIFDPNRSPRRAAPTTPRPQQRTVDSLSLVGIMSYEKGTFAFFDGSRSDFKKVVKESGDIAGFKVASVDPDVVRLSAGDQDFELKVGMQLRREEQGKWEKSSQPVSFDSPAAPAPAGRSSSSSSGQSAASAQPDGAADEVLKRLMQRREQE